MPTYDYLAQVAPNSDAVEMALAEHEKGMSPDELEQRARQQVYLASESALAHGITSFQDAGTSFENIDFLRMLEQEGALPIRLYVMVRYEPVERLAELLPHYRMPAEENDFLVVRSIKQQIDGALGVHGAWLLEPYIDKLMRRRDPSCKSSSNMRRRTLLDFSVAEP